MLGGFDFRDPRSSQAIFATLNTLAGLNKENIKWWLATQDIKDSNVKIGDDFADKLASLIIASPYRVSKAILTEYYNCCMIGINPEKSPTFRRKMITGALPAHVHTLQEKATDLSLRASASRRQEPKKDVKSGGF